MLFELILRQFLFSTGYYPKFCTKYEACPKPKPLERYNDVSPDEIKRVRDVS